MCNPRRISVTASRQLDEAWQHEVSRTVELSANVVGEARVRQPLDADLSAQTLRALELALAAPESGWTEVDEGYRRDVDGGHVLYRVDERALEIVASENAEVRALGEARQEVEGRVTSVIEAEGEGRYYDDGYGGRTEETARRDAQTEAEGRLDSVVRERLENARRNAEGAHGTEVEAAARARAETTLRDRQEQRRAQLEQEARRHLESVGLRARQAFYRVLAQAYRDSILAYARTHQAEGISTTENDDTIEIEFRVTR